jgi:hypothetical protein
MINSGYFSQPPYQQYGFGGYGNYGGGYGFNPYQQYGFGGYGMMPQMGYGYGGYGMNPYQQGGDFMAQFQAQLQDMFDKYFSNKEVAPAADTSVTTTTEEALPVPDSAADQTPPAVDESYKVKYNRNNSIYASQADKQAAYNALTPDQQAQVKAGKIGVGRASGMSTDPNKAVVSGQITELTGPGAAELSQTQRNNNTQTNNNNRRNNNGR